MQFANSELALKAVENLNGRELLGREAEPCDRVGGGDGKLSHNPGHCLLWSVMVMLMLSQLW